MTNLWVSTADLGSYSESEYSYDAAKAASQLLWALTGRKYTGTNTVTERYVCFTRWHSFGLATGTTTAIIANGNMQNIPLTANSYYETASDGVTPGARLKLRGTPVQKIHAIRDHLGEIVNPNYYYLSDHSTIQPTIGVPWWPCNIEVTYTYGAPPPAMGQMAARTLAIEFCKMWAGEDCELPQRVTSISRQGVSYTILDPQDFVQEGRTGLYMVDMFLKSVNPDKARNRARVFSPDTSRARRINPKELKLAASPTDITILRNTPGTVDLTLAYLNAAFLLDGTGWTRQVTINNWSGARTLDLEQNATELVSSNTALRITIPYDKAFSVLGLVDPGTWDLYASRPSLVTPGATETVYIASGNLKIMMAEQSLNPIVTIGD